MKSIFFTLLALSVTTFLSSQEILRHFDPEDIPPVADTFANGLGYLTGHNDYGDEEFAEKYEIQGSGLVHGVVAIHRGQEGTSTFNSSYRVYNTGNNGLPNAALANINVPYNDVPINGEPFTVTFNNPVNVTDTFFVSFRLGDYSHGGYGTKRIAIAHAPHGTRPDSDFGVYGRNVVRWHSHGSTVWKDYRTENFTDYQPAVYFSLFPIIELEPMSVINFDNQVSIGAAYPNPSSSGDFHVPINSLSGGEAVFRLFDLTGKLITEKNTELQPGKSDYKFSTTHTKPGIYVLFVSVPEGKITQKVVIK